MEIRGAVILVTILTVLVFGGVVTSLSVRAARRTSARALWSLATGLALITIGTAVIELLLLDAKAAVDGADLVGSLLLATGFAILAYSIYGGYP
ncbi:putative membrane protein [Halanaeroarchaeum sp. HSR-CO]|uniref:DUF7521 family protein n=1 Tax=Halanaeroarchaeum sp. HSR-CO TaxID=2866382 RepID=UPI00217E37E2|nr:hypothetical protein [Halanaeroarchaeum sp. HSR-CO]UWG47953.1 putative membrane protein [Halanaeroarchaeum sp. HSR-CO]